MDIAIEFDNIENIEYNNLIKISRKNNIIEQIKHDIVFLFFNLTRKHRETSVFEIKNCFMNVLDLLKKKSKSDSGTESGTDCIGPSDIRFCLSIILRLIIHTRDSKFGKGEHELSYMLIHCLYQYFPILAIFLVKRIVIYSHDGIGCWRDIKYLCEYISKNSVRSSNDSFIHECLEIMNHQLRKDLAVVTRGNYYTKYSISNIAKWIPRENKHFSWLFDKLVLNWFDFPMYVGPENRELPPVFDKYRRLYRKTINHINRILDTTEIKQCSRELDKIIPENVSKYTLMKQHSLYFDSVSVDGSESLCMYNQKMICNKNFDEYFTQYFFHNREPGIHHEHGEKDGENGVFRRFFADLPISFFIKQAFLLYENPTMDGFDKKVSILNKQWDIFYGDFFHRFIEKNREQEHREQYIIPVLDISQSNQWLDSESFYTGLGIAILIALINGGDFNKRFMCIDNLPTWVAFDKTDIFSIVSTVFDLIKSRNSTYANFYSAIDLIKNTIIETDIDKSFIENMKIVFLSDFDNINGQFYNNLVHHFIRNEYWDENLDIFMDMDMDMDIDNLIKLDEYFIPHFTFWNLSKKQVISIPCSHKQPKTKLLSGFSPSVLTDFFANIENIHDSPYDFIVGILNTHRYDFIDEYLSKIIILSS
jgi:hypothetical protein